MDGEYSGDDDMAGDDGEYMDGDVGEYSGDDENAALLPDGEDGE